jgi:hypothetical protein
MQLVGSIHRGIVETVSLAVLRDLAMQSYGLAVDDMTVELQPGDERSLGFRRAGTIRKFLGLIRVQVDVVGMVTVDNDLVLRFRDVTSRATMKGVGAGSIVGTSTPPVGSRYLTATLRAFCEGGRS